MQNGRKRLITLLSGAALIATLGLVPSGSAQAKPDIDDVQAKVDRLYHEAEQASERYNDARLELKDLLVSSSHHGNGLADELLGLVPRREPVFLWVYRDSAPAREFYESAGFVATGATGIDDDTGVGVLLMVRDH